MLLLLGCCVRFAVLLRSLLVFAGLRCWAASRRGGLLHLLAAPRLPAVKYAQGALLAPIAERSWPACVARIDQTKAETGAEPEPEPEPESELELESEPEPELG